MSNSHLVVVGSGVAGLYGALLAAEAGVRVTLLTKGTLAQSNTHQAQGGICAVLAAGEAAPGDTVEAHIADTLKAGAGQCNPDAVRILCSEAASDIGALERFGVRFDRDATGKRALGLEGAHSAARILHAGGDATGAAIANGLIAAVRDAATLGLITLLEGCFATDLLTRPDLVGVHGAHDAGTPPRAAIAGIAYLDPRNERRVLEADAILLATGGAGQLFEFTTNPQVATGDGVALAWRAGAVLADLEHFQFHPTALAMGQNFLISEAVRGAGAVLRDANGEAFMPHYHPEGDLAPRDVVSRSIAAHLAALAVAANTAGEPDPAHHVFLDATGIEAANGAGYLARRFPTIDATTAALGFDWRRDWLPVAPAAHYWMGGVATDLHGRTNIPGLFAAGEAACTGVHGANRLASNSLLEGLVFSRRAVTAFEAAANGERNWPLTYDGATRLPSFPAPPEGEGKETEAPALSRTELRHLMASHAGVVRDAGGLKLAADALGLLPQAPIYPATRYPDATIASGAGLRGEHEDNNLHLVAQLLVNAALARENSVGAHFRSDFPQGPDIPQSPNFTQSPDVPQPAHVPTAGPTREANHWVNPVPVLATTEPQRESETV